ncbi:MAG: 3-methyl-2-oxobutanoate hydroxymethyltransferase [Magnetococcales bacterium]|nr:3-methyl-2-oxobutanoate hydroxymethyltransferase [Magnetococcales bacterium]
MGQRITLPKVAQMKEASQRIVCVTAYDYTFAQLVDRAGVDIILVGDSLGMVVQGHETTLPVTLDDMIYHTTAVVRGSQRSMVICDFPFGICQSPKEMVLAAAVRIMKESGCDGVKIEGGEVVADTIRYLTRQQIPVVAHVGLTPQSVKFFGGFKVQGKDKPEADKILVDALAVEAAGAFAVVLEGIPPILASEITEKLSIPTIGIGAGVECDGQVLVIYDLLGLNDDFKPKFVKQYMHGADLINTALKQFTKEVREGVFPGPDQQ